MCSTHSSDFIHITLKRKKETVTKETITFHRKRINRFEKCSGLGKHLHTGTPRRLSCRFNAVTGLIFQESHQDQGDDEGSDEEVQRRSVAVGRFLDDRYQDRTGDAGSAPGRQYPAVNGTEVLGSEEIAEVSRHAGETAAVAGNDEQE